MGSASIQRILRNLLLSTFILGCGVALTMVYFKIITIESLEPVEHHQQSTASIRIHRPVKSHLKNRDKNVTTVLVWFSSHIENSKIDGCFITTDRNLYSKSDGVIIHHRDLSSDMSNLPALKRPSFQKWIWMDFEPPSRSQRIPWIDTMFNLTLSYRQDADIKSPYGSLVAGDGEEDLVPPSKDKLVCWIVSNWKQNLVRVNYYYELCKHINVHVYGANFGGRLPWEDFFPTISSCKFYLSFENSISKDYITEKLYNPLSVGTVPVVLGPPRQNYEDFIQGDAFIHVDDFATPKKLADYLLLLDKNDEMYLRYFEWRRHFKAKNNYIWELRPVCEYLRRHKEHKTVDNLDKWFWG